MAKLLLFTVLLQGWIAVVYSSCGKNFENVETGQFNSPNYPINYTMGLTCEWKITVPAGSRINLTLSEVDILSQDSGDVGCGSNKLSVQTEAGSLNAPDDYCKQTQPTGDILSVKNAMIIKFVTPKLDATAGKGFNASFVVINPITTTIATPTTTSTTTNTTVVPTNSTTITPAPVTQPPKKEGLSGGAIAAIVIVVILIVLLVVDVILYQKDMGVIYTCKRACCGDYGGVPTS